MPFASISWLNRRARSPGRKGQSPGTLRTDCAPGRLAAAQSSAGEDSRERSLTIRNPVGDDRQAERREAPGIAIGAENEAVALRLEPLDDAGEDRAPADRAQRLVAAAHAPRQSAGKDDARRAGTSAVTPAAPGAPRA